MTTNASSDFERLVEVIRTEKDEDLALSKMSKALDERPLLPYAIDETAFTLLHHAVQRRRGSVVTLLLDRGADPNAIAFSGESPILLATEVEREPWQNYLVTKSAQQRILLESVESLIHAGDASSAIATLKAHPEAVHGWVYDAPLLLMAAFRGRNTLPVVKHMLEKDVDPNCVDEDGNTALHRVMARPVETRNETADLVRTLLSSGADINWRDREGFTPLHAAATHGHWEDRVKLLVELGADINAESDEGETPLDIVYSLKIMDARSLARWMKAHGARCGKN
jgi:ankyrin repeat protein